MIRGNRNELEERCKLVMKVTFLTTGTVEPVAW